MVAYPKALLPHKPYPVLQGEDVIEYYFVRETVENLYLVDREEIDDFLKKIVAPQESLREVFGLSIILYGYYNEKYVGIRSENYEPWSKDLDDLSPKEISYSKEELYPLFMKSSLLYNKEIDYNGQNYHLSFYHCPTRTNYWHFELCTKDSQGTCISRDTRNSTTKKLAEIILGEYVRIAISSPSDVKKFRRNDFDKMINGPLYSILIGLFQKLKFWNSL